jgi:hypothetical protein
MGKSPNSDDEWAFGLNSGGSGADLEDLWLFAQVKGWVLIQFTQNKMLR